MAKFKHNKKRNSAFLYEVLIKELTRAVLANNDELRESITKLIKESYSKDSMIHRELKLYRAVTHTKNVGIITAEKIVNEVKIRHKELNKKQLMSEQNKLVRKIRKNLSDSVFSNFVPNYKDLASIAQIFNYSTSIKSKVLLENELVGKMCDKKVQEEMIPINNLVYKSFAKRFNEQYQDKLLEEQKILLNKFITSFSNNGMELKIYLNDEIGRLKKELKKSFLSEEFLNDEDMTDNMKKVMKLLESYKEQRPNEDMVKEVVKIQSLVQELNLSGN